jgi:hypothetical protein
MSFECEFGTVDTDYPAHEIATDQQLPQILAGSSGISVSGYPASLTLNGVNFTREQCWLGSAGVMAECRRLKARIAALA